MTGSQLHPANQQLLPPNTVPRIVDCQHQRKQFHLLGQYFLLDILSLECRQRMQLSPLQLSPLQLSPLLLSLPLTIL
jgi:hypothetical protein